MSSRRATALAVVLTLLLAIAAAIRWTSASRPSAGVSPAPRPSAAAVAAPAATAPLRTLATFPTATATPGPAANLARAEAREEQRRARYPHSSQPLQPGQVDPILSERIPSHGTFPGPNGEGPALVVFPDQVSFEPPDSVVLYAYLTQDGSRVPAQRIDGEIVDEEGQVRAHLQFNDSGSDADREAGDLLYTAQMPDAGSGPPGGAYLVRVRALSAAGDERAGSTGFLYSRPDAQLTGRWTDSLSDGNLRVQAEVEVQRAGRFHLEATLYTRDGTPLAWAQNALNLPAGRHWIPLSFFGLILREHGADGPYVVRYASLSTTTSMPNAKNRLVTNAYVTAPYRAADFSDRTFDDPAAADVGN